VEVQSKMKVNAICERFLGSVRRECLDQRLIMSERQLCRVIREYLRYFNEARPHQEIHQEIPEVGNEEREKVRGENHRVSDPERVAP
jgi:transposase InsO family protein